MPTEVYESITQQLNLFRNTLSARNIADKWYKEFRHQPHYSRNVHTVVLHTQKSIITQEKLTQLSETRMKKAANHP